MMMTRNVMKTSIIGFLKLAMIGMLCFGYAFAEPSPGPQDGKKGQSQQSAGANSGQSSTNDADKVNINTDGLEQLKTLPRIGPKLAQRIIDFRTEHGNFKTLEELMNVTGIGPKTFKGLKPLIKL